MFEQGTFFFKKKTEFSLSRLMAKTKKKEAAARARAGRAQA